jgi:Na+/proline symporter
MLDAGILIAFLLSLIGIGRWVSGRVRSTLDFHLAGRRQGQTSWVLFTSILTRVLQFPIL